MPRFPLDAPCSLITLPSGFRVACIAVDGLLADFELVIQQGESSETKAEDLQMSHLCEHLLDRLTSKRFKDYKKIENILAQDSIYSNASVDEHQTTFVLRGMRDDAMRALEFLLESFVDPWIDEALFETERHSIVEELRGKMTSSESFVVGVNQVIFPERLSSGSSLDFKIRNLNKLQCQDVMKWTQKLFNPRQAMLFLVCHTPLAILRDISPILARARDSFSLVPKEVPTLKIPSQKIYFVPWKNSAHDRLAFVFPLFMTLASEKVIPVMAWTTILVDPTCMYSRLMRDLRTELKAVYSLHSEMLLDPVKKDRSYLIIDISCEPRLTEMVVEQTMLEFAKLKRKGMTVEEYQRYQKSLLIEEQKQQDNKSPARYLKNYKSHLLWKNRYVTNQELHNLKRTCSLREVNHSCQTILSFAKMKLFVGHKFTRLPQVH